MCTYVWLSCGSVLIVTMTWPKSFTKTVAKNTIESEAAERPARFCFNGAMSLLPNRASSPAHQWMNSIGGLRTTFSRCFQGLYQKKKRRATHDVVPRPPVFRQWNSRDYICMNWRDFALYMALFVGQASKQNWGWESRTTRLTQL